MPRMKFTAVFIVINGLCFTSNTDAFTHSLTQKSSISTLSTSALYAAGMGMGVSSSKKKGKKGTTTASFDVSKSCLKSEKLYDELMKESAKLINGEDDEFDSVTAEYVITARLSPSATKERLISGAASISDWVPVAQLCLKRHIDDPNFDASVRECEKVKTAVSFYCREISYFASLGASIFKSVPRNAIEYSVEPVDSFYKFVYEDVIEGKKVKQNSMTKAEARSVLQLEEGCNDSGEIKRSYRKLTFALHPDRFVGESRSEEEIKQASDDFAKVKEAYDVLSSGVRANNETNGKVLSWYESLGGRSRTDFSGPLTLLALEKAKEDFIRQDYKAAVCGLNPETVMAFVTRNQASVR
jgi:hypothetical protein